VKEARYQIVQRNIQELGNLGCEHASLGSVEFNHRMDGLGVGPQGPRE